MTSPAEPSPMLNGVEKDEDEGGTDSRPKVLDALAAVLVRLVARNDDLMAAAGGNGKDRPDSGDATITALHSFRAARPPSISVERYLERIYKYTGCSPSCFVVAFAYLDRLVHRHPGSLLVSLNIHRLLLTGVLVASKVLDDVHHDNAFYARVGGVSNNELNHLELELLFLLDFGVTVSSKIFESYCLHLEKELLLRGVVNGSEDILATENNIDAQVKKLMNA